MDRRIRRYASLRRGEYRRHVWMGATCMRQLFLWLRLIAILFAWFTINFLNGIGSISPVFNGTIIFTLLYVLAALLLEFNRYKGSIQPVHVLTIGDLIALTIITYISGGLESPWFVMYYLVLAVVSLQATMVQVFVYSALLSLSYLGAVLAVDGSAHIDTLAIRVFVLYIMGAITAMLARELISERNKAEQRAHGQHMLRESSQALTGSLNISQISTVIQEAGRTIGGCDMAVLILVEEHGVLGAEMQEENHLLVLPYHELEHLTGRTALSTLERDQSQSVSPLPPYLKECVVELQSAVSAYVLPLLLKGHLLGLVVLGWSRFHIPSQDDSELLKTFTNQVTVALETARHYSRALRASITDPLTGLYNHRYLKERLEEELHQARAHEQPLTVMMIDIDRFKTYNDVLGHIAGDTALRVVADLLVQELGDRPIYARYGGDEFLVVLPEVELNQAKLQAARLHQGVSELVEQKRVPSAMSLSIGLAGFPEHGTNRASLLDSVDLALFLAKYDGGSCTRLANEVGSARGIEAIFAKMAMYLAQSRSSSGPGLAADLERRLEQFERLRQLDGSHPVVDPVAETLAIQTITALATAIEAKDSYTRGHSQNVSMHAVALAHALDCSDHELEEVRIGGLLHDIGKIGIPDTILNKPGPLDAQEWEIMKTHSAIGSRILMPVLHLQSIALIVLHHHERYDGTGYPAGLAGESIPLASRIIAICDAYDVMTVGRPYRPPLSHEEAIKQLERGAGAQFDPRLVSAFTALPLGGQPCPALPNFLLHTRAGTLS